MQHSRSVDGRSWSGFRRVAVLPGMLAMVVAGVAGAQGTRDYISIVGSSTVYPFSTVAAERFGRTTEFRTPKVEATGSGGGIQLFCSGVGVRYPDIVNSSRAIKPGEIETCAVNGVTGIIPIRIGYDGIVLASALDAPPLDLRLRDIYLALAKNVPDPDEPGSLVPNQHQTWHDVNPALPARPIEVLGPPPTSGTRDAFVELAMEGGCRTFPWIEALSRTDEQRFKVTCQAIREDGRFVEVGENDNLIVQKLRANPRALGIFGYSFLEQNTDSVQGARVNGQPPTFEAIAAGDYPISRPLFVYVKKSHIGSIPGLRRFMAELTSPAAMGAEGYLAEKGMIPLPAAEYRRVKRRVERLETIPVPRAGAR